MTLFASFSLRTRLSTHGFVLCVGCGFALLISSPPTSYPLLFILRSQMSSSIHSRFRSFFFDPHAFASCPWALRAHCIFSYVPIRFFHLGIPARYFIAYPQAIAPPGAEALSLELLLDFFLGSLVPWYPAQRILIQHFHLLLSSWPLSGPKSVLGMPSLALHVHLRLHLGLIRFSRESTQAPRFGLLIPAVTLFIPIILAS